MGQRRAPAAGAGGGRFGGQQRPHKGDGVIPQQAVGLAARAAVDAAAGRVGRLACDARGAQRGGVAQHDVPADAVEQQRVVRHDGVQVGAGGQRVRPGKQVLVPAVAVHGLPGRHCVRAYKGGAARGDIGRAGRAEQIDRGEPAADVEQMQVAVVEARQRPAAAKVGARQFGRRGGEQLRPAQRADAPALRPQHAGRVAGAGIKMPVVKKPPGGGAGGGAGGVGFVHGEPLFLRVCYSV